MWIQRWRQRWKTFMTKPDLRSELVSNAEGIYAQVMQMIIDYGEAVHQARDWTSTDPPKVHLAISCISGPKSDPSQCSQSVCIILGLTLLLT